MNKDYTVILNGYKRPHTLKQQITAISRQTIPVKNIFYWENYVKDVVYDDQSSSLCISAKCNTNFGVWSRFSYALNVRTNWICVLDDDTIPGSQWIENCFQTMNDIPDAALLGTIGIRFPEKKYSFTFQDRIGWDNPNDKPEQVDLVGHNWFFHRDMLSIFWRELPPIDHNFISSEDIHFSAMIQKYTNKKTYVPPHPTSNYEMWGSLQGWKLGADSVATAGIAYHLFEEGLTKYINNGFKLMCENNI